MARGERRRLGVEAADRLLVARREPAHEVVDQERLIPVPADPRRLARRLIRG